MTTEILTNTLFNQELKTSALSFDIDIENELAAVVFDEVHYINDPERGSVWEQAIIKLPPQVQLIMLSATIDKAHEFASWVGNIKQKKTNLIPTTKRVVPLEHYFYNHERDDLTKIVDSSSKYINYDLIIITLYEHHLKVFSDIFLNI